MAKKKTNRLFKSAEHYKRRTVTYNDDYSAFKTKRIILIEIYKYGPHEKLKQRKLMEKVNSYASLVGKKTRQPLANWIFTNSAESARLFEEVLGEAYNRNEEGEIIEEDE